MYSARAQLGNRHTPLVCRTRSYVAQRLRFGGKGAGLSVRKTRHAIIFGFLFLLVSAVYLRAPLHPSPAAENSSASGGSGGAPNSQGSSTTAGNVSNNTNVSGRLQPVTAHVIAGGAGAGKAPFAASSQLPSGPGVPAEVVAAAQTGLAFFLEQIPAGS